MSENRIVISDTLLRLLVCIAVSHRGLTDEEWQFMRRLEKELFDDVVCFENCIFQKKEEK